MAGNKNESEDLFGVGVPKDENKYPIDLNSIPSSPADEPSAPLDPEWDINSTVPRSRPVREEPPVAPPTEVGESRERPDISSAEDIRRGRDRELRGANREDPRFREERLGARGGNGGRNDGSDFDIEDIEEYNEDESAPNLVSRAKDKFLSLSKKGRIIAIAVIAILLVVVISIATSALSGVTAEEPTETKPPVSEEEPEPTETQAPSPEPITQEWQSKLFVMVGEKGVTVDGLEVMVTEAKCDVPAADKKGVIVESENGVWCSVKFTAKNISNDVLTLHANKFKITDIYGEEVYPGHEKYSDVGGGNVIVKLAQNESISGVVYFDVPKGTEVSEISASTFGNVGGSPVTITVNDVINKEDEVEVPVDEEETDEEAAADEDEDNLVE